MDLICWNSFCHHWILRIACLGGGI